MSKDGKNLNPSWIPLMTTKGLGWAWAPLQLSQPVVHQVDPTHGLPAIMTVEETAKFLGLSSKTVHASIADGELPGKKVRHRTLIYRDALLQWLQSKPRVPTRRKRNR